VDGDLVLADELGGPLASDAAHGVVQQDRKAAAIPTGTLHILRHTRATLRVWTNS